MRNQIKMFHKVLVGSCVPGLVFISGACKPDPEEKARAVKAAQESYANLRVIETSARSGGAQCPVDKFKEKAGEGKTLYIKTFSVEQLRYLQGKGKIENSYWDFLYSDIGLKPLEEYTYIFQIEGADRKIKDVMKSGYAAIVIPAGRRAPHAMPEDSFSPGYIQVRIVILDLSRKRGVCAFFARAESSETVFFKKNKFNEKLKSDLKNNYRKAVREAFKKISGDAAKLDI